MHEHTIQAPVAERGCVKRAPGIVGMFIGMRTEQRVQRLRRRQRDLVEEWGPGVAGGRRDGEDKPGATPTRPQ